MSWGRYGSCLIATKTVCWTVTNSPWPCTWWTSNWTGTTYLQSSLNISFHHQKEDSNHTESLLIRCVFIENPSRQSCSPQIKMESPKFSSWHHSSSSFVEVFYHLLFKLIVICYQSTNRGVANSTVHRPMPKASQNLACWYIWWASSTFWPIIRSGVLKNRSQFKVMLWCYVFY